MAPGTRIIIWLNGPFGVGKTTAARLLVKRLVQASIVDPELIGWAIKRLSPSGIADYQRLSLWRLLTRTWIWFSARQNPITIVPMTVLDEKLLLSFLASRSPVAIESRHIILHADRQALHNRILNDTTDRDALRWRIINADRYFAEYDQLKQNALVIDTSKLSPDEVYEEILRAL